MQLQCFHIDLSKYSWSLKQVSIFLYLLLYLCFKEGLGSKMVTDSKRCTFGRTWNACLKAKGCCQPWFAVKVIFSGTVLRTVSVHFSSAVCWGKALPCQCPRLDIGKNLTNANAGEDVLKIILAWNWQRPRLFFRRAKPGRRRFPGPDRGSLARPSRQFCSHDARGRREKIAFDFFFVCVCERIWNICRRQWRENLLLLGFFFPFFFPFPCRWLTLRWGVLWLAIYSLASIPQAVALLAAFLETAPACALGLHGFLASASLAAVLMNVGVSYKGASLGFAWGAACEYKL